MKLQFYLTVIIISIRVDIRGVIEPIIVMVIVCKGPIGLVSVKVTPARIVIAISVSSGWWSYVIFMKSGCSLCSTTTTTTRLRQRIIIQLPWISTDGIIVFVIRRGVRGPTEQLSVVWWLRTRVLGFYLFVQVSQFYEAVLYKVAL